MLDVHEWTMQAFETHKTLKCPVMVRRYQFGEGTGDVERELEVTVLGTTSVSIDEPLSYARVFEDIEYGTASYKDCELKVVGPIPGYRVHWSCYGLPVYRREEKPLVHLHYPQGIAIMCDVCLDNAQEMLRAKDQNVVLTRSALRLLIQEVGLAYYNERKYREEHEDQINHRGYK